MLKRTALRAIWLILLAAAACIVIRARMPLPVVGFGCRGAKATPAPYAEAFESTRSVSLTAKPEKATAQPATREPTASPVPTPFSVFWMSDTQVYSYAAPSVFLSMTDWMSAQVQAYNAQFAVHTGDIVDNRKLDRHWKNADKALRRLSGKLPLLCVAGNHDVGATDPDYTEYLTFGFCDVTDSEELYQGGVCWSYPFTAGGDDFAVIGIGWQKSEEYLPFVRRKLMEYGERSVIFLVHDFLTDSGALTGNGQLLEEEILSVFPNVFLVLCGHNDGSAQWTKTYMDDKRTVNALMYNFQDDRKNGLGYLRILTFYPETRALGVVTYSPHLDDYSYFSDEGRDMFMLFDAY